MNLAQQEKAKSREIMKRVIYTLLAILSFTFFFNHISYDNYEEFPDIISILGSFIIILFSYLATSREFKEKLKKEGTKTTARLIIALMWFLGFFFITTYYIPKKKSILAKCEFVKAKVIKIYTKTNLQQYKNHYITVEFKTLKGKIIKKEMLINGKLPFEFVNKLQDYIYVCYDKKNPYQVIIPKREFINKKTGIKENYIRYADLKESLFLPDTLILPFLLKINKGWKYIFSEKKWENSKHKSRIIKHSKDTLKFFSVLGITNPILTQLNTMSKNFNYDSQIGDLLYEDSLLQVYILMNTDDIHNIQMGFEFCKKK